MTILTDASIVVSGLLISAAILVSPYGLTRRPPPTVIPGLDVIRGIRCVDFEQHVFVAEPGKLSTKDAGWAKASEPFDVTINLTQKTGWFDDGGSEVAEDRPADLVITPSKYELLANEDIVGRTYSTWLVLYRVDGHLSFYAQKKRMPTEELKRGGTCSEIRAKF